MQNETYRNAVEEVLRICRAEKRAVQTIKSITRRPYPGDGHSHATWYEPLTDQASIDKAVHWVLGNEDVFLNTAGDITLLPMVLRCRAYVSSSARQTMSCGRWWKQVICSRYLFRREPIQLLIG